MMLEGFMFTVLTTVHRERNSVKRESRLPSKLLPSLGEPRSLRENRMIEESHIGEWHSSLAHLSESHKDQGSPREWSHSGGNLDSLLILYLFSMYST